MKKKVLGILWDNKGNYVSGEQISNNLAVSRTAIWKHIKALKEEGYEIESLPRLGYCLLNEPNLLLPQEIKRGLTTKWLINQDIHYYRTIDSTNIQAKKLAIQGAPEGTVVIAEEQTAGKGRLGRLWASPLGQGLWLSLILRPQITPLQAPKIIMVAAVALQETITEFTGLRVGIKWPNDILMEEKKIAGILVEMSGEMDTVNYLIVGIGVNMNMAKQDFPEEIREKASSLRVGLGKEVCRIGFTRLLLRKLEDYYTFFRQGDYQLLLDKWREASCTLGKEIRVTMPTEVIEGRAVGFGEEGSLLVQLNNGSVREIMAGDVTLRLS